MRSTLLSTDRFGDFILSSQVYTNARDLARLGLLHLQGGEWNGQRIISKGWIDFVRAPAPATAQRNNEYGGHWWLVPDSRKSEQNGAGRSARGVAIARRGAGGPAEEKDVPRDAYSTAGNRGQYVVVVPSHDLVIVRRGLDYGRQGFSQWDLAREVIKAVTPKP